MPEKLSVDESVSVTGRVLVAFLPLFIEIVRGVGGLASTVKLRIMDEKLQPVPSQA
jgi:hypothetical protein